MAEQLIEVDRGEDATADFTTRDLDGEIVDVTGFTILFTVAESVDSAVKLLEVDGVVISGPDGTFRVVLEADETEDFDPGSYYWDAWRMDTGQKKKLAAGPFVVKGVARLPPAEA